MERFGNLTTLGVLSPKAACADEPAFVLIEPLRRAAPLVFASPHSGRRYPEPFLAQCRAPLASLRRSEDAYVDELFAGAPAAGAPLLSALVARTYLDLNRCEGELDPDMLIDPPASLGPGSARVRAGLGVAPRIAADGEEIYPGRLAHAEIESRLARLHRPYHDTLAALLEETRALFGVAALIDCHSMPSCARGPGQADFVLGDRFGAACGGELTALVERTLRRMGYRVARNAPFAGGHTTQRHGRPGEGVHALQIEVNRALYMNERTLERGAGFDRVRADMTRLVAALAEAPLPALLARH